MNFNMNIDYYNVLGLKKEASKEEIKKTYRKMSLKHHPDRKGGSAEAFKKINEAYEVLSDDNKKKQYDRGRGFNQINRNRGQNLNGANIDVFSRMFGFPIHSMNGTNISEQMRRQYGVGVNNRIPLVQKKLVLTLEEVYSGVTRNVQIEKMIYMGNNNHMRKLVKVPVMVTVPPGVNINDTLILRGRGNELGPNLKGDLKIFFEIKKHNLFTRDNMDLILKKNITWKESLVGFTFEIQHLSGKKYKINNNDGKVIKDGYVKRIEGLGMKKKHAGSANRYSVGNLLILFETKQPDRLSLEIRNKLKEIL